MSIRFDRHIILQTAGLAALLVFTAMPMSSAFAQNTDVNGRISRIENEIQTLSRAIFKGETPPPGAFSSGDNAAQAATENRLSQIERDLQTLTGRLEEMSFELNRLTNIANMQQTQPASQPVQSVPQPGSGMGMSTTTVSGPGTLTMPAAEEGLTMADPNAPASANRSTSGQLGSLGSTPDGPTAAYESAFTMLRNQDYAGAQTAFDAFIKANPNHALVPNAMYWLGETYYVRNEFAQATRIFAESYQKYPKGAKAADNLLKLGMSLAGMGKTADACVALAQLKKEYPAGAAPVLSRADQEIERLKCK